MSRTSSVSIPSCIIAIDINILKQRLQKFRNPVLFGLVIILIEFCKEFGRTLNESFWLWKLVLFWSPNSRWTMIIIRQFAVSMSFKFLGWSPECPYAPPRVAIQKGGIAISCQEIHDYHNKTDWTVHLHGIEFYVYALQLVGYIWHVVASTASNKSE